MGSMGTCTLPSRLHRRSARAAQAQDTADSARLYKEGWSLYQEKQYTEACPLLERSLAAAPTIRTRGALALCYEGQRALGLGVPDLEGGRRPGEAGGRRRATRMKRAQPEGRRARRPGGAGGVPGRRQPRPT